MSTHITSTPTCTALTTMPAGDPAVSGSCYSPQLAGVMFLGVLALVLFVAVGTWIARAFQRPTDVGSGREIIITREGTYERPVA